ncbi:MAG: Energy-dependent translational throttle protein EttA [Chlamydiae bacterium]|nr:Energy-dependent translational throttle protein EttA [Chlamydiota bacterium]
MSFFSQQFIKLHSISKSFGPKTVLTDLSLTISHADRIALIGENGSGKTTLVRLAIGLEDPDYGEVSISDDCTIGYLPQDLEYRSDDMSIQEYILESQGDLKEISLRLRELEDLMSQESGLSEVADEWDTLHQKFLAKEGYTLAERSEEYLSALGLGSINQKRFLSSLSGGERRRVALATLLLQHPDVLVLDEPTNHLDRSALEWLENFLAQYRGAMLMISHDREFLNRTANGIFELSRTLNYYPGDYDSYVAQKEKELQDQLERFQKQQEEMASLKKFLKAQTFAAKKPTPPKDNNKIGYERHGGKFVRAKKTVINQAKGKLETLESEKMEHPIPKDYTGIVFHPVKLESATAMKIKGVKVEIDGKVLINSLTENLCPGDRVILQGPNGCGKSCLLRMLASQKFDSVSYSPQVRIGYLSQEPEFSNESISVIEYLQKRFSLPEHKLRSRLNQIGLIEGRYIGQKIATLSLGQKRRFQLLELMLDEVNVLLLDEPTNHLAPHVIDQLEEALLKFSGAVIAATHDRRFANRVGTSKWEW